MIATLLVGDPVGGDTAQRAAERELRKGEYHRDDPGLATRLLHWIGRRLDWLFGGSATGSALLVLIVLIVAVVIFAVVRAGPPRRTRTRPDAGGLDRSGQLAARDHRRLAEQLTESRRWADALREWLRCVVATLEERGLLDPRPGRTAAEVARAAATLLPATADAVHAAARTFDEVWFGGRPANQADAVLARTAADQVRIARASAPTPAGAAGYAAPR